MSQPQLGQRLRAVRLANGYTISQVALLSGLSKSFLSMLENGHTNISATRLHSLAGIFGLTATDFLPDASARALVHVVRGDEAPRIGGFGEGTEARLLTRDLHRRLQPVLLHIEPGARHGNPTGHAGEEFIHVLAGTLRLTVDEGPPVDLGAGDSAYYPSALSHHYENPGADAAVLITISTPHSWHKL